MSLFKLAIFESLASVANAEGICVSKPGMEKFVAYCTQDEMDCKSASSSPYCIWKPDEEFPEGACTPLPDKMEWREYCDIYVDDIEMCLRYDTYCYWGEPNTEEIQASPTTNVPTTIGSTSTCKNNALNCPSGSALFYHQCDNEKYWNWGEEYNEDFFSNACPASCAEYDDKYTCEEWEQLHGSRREFYNDNYNNDARTP